MALCYSDVQDALIRGAEVFSHKSMFDSVSKIAQAIRRCKMQAEQVQWVFCLMLDRALEGFTSVGEMSNQSFFGTQSTKGHIDVMLALLELKDKLLSESVPSLGLSAQVVQALQKNFTTVTAYRKKVPPAPIDDSEARGKPYFAWMAGWSLTEKKVVQFIEGILFKDHFKRELKQVLSNRQSSVELLKVEDIKKLWDGMAEAIANETQQAKLGGSAPVEQDQGQDPIEENLDHVTFIPPNTDEAKEATVKQYQEQTFTIVDQSITLLIEAKDESGNVEMLRSAIKSFDIAPAVVDGVCSDL